MTRRLFEYTIVTHIPMERKWIGLTEINEMGLDGWELCATINHDTYIEFYFKREIDGPRR